MESNAAEIEIACQLYIRDCVSLMPIFMCVVPGLTMDLQAARCLCLAHAILRHTGVGALVLSPNLGQTQAVVTADI